jgi:hypothetical protein
MHIGSRFAALLLLLVYSLSYVQQCGKFELYSFVLLTFIPDANLAAMSVDLGSEFIKIGLVKPGVPMEVVLNKESRRKTPNIVALRNGERFFGDVAAQMVGIC